MLELNVIGILKKKNKTKYWLYNKFETMSYTNFNNMITNKTKSVKYENIEKLCKYLDCSVDELFVYKR